MMKYDLEDGYDRMVRLEKSTTTELKKILRAKTGGSDSTKNSNSTPLDEKLIDRARGIKRNYMLRFLEQTKY